MITKSDILHNLGLDVNSHVANNHQAVAGDLLLRNLFKKCVRKGNEANLKRKALETFLEVNEEVGKWNPPPLYDDDVSTVIGEGALFLQRLFPDSVTLSDSFVSPLKGSYGNGSTIGIKGTSLATKLAGPLHYHNSAARNLFARAHLAHPPFRSRTIEALKGRVFCAESKLTTVPKNDNTDRCICIEPLADMFYQQALRWSLEAKLREIGLDLRVQQDVQRHLALVGSVDDSLSTIDLSSASDRIGYRFCKWYLPRGLMWQLEQCRVPAALSDVVGRVELNMVSTMGNATTFPLQTLIFLSLIFGVYQYLNIPFRLQGSRRTVGVNGDDLIIVPKAYDILVRSLEACGFRVNLEKSFKFGLFKESCGGDYYEGVDVRPVYCKRLNALQDWYSLINRLSAWSTFHNVDISRTIAMMKRSIRKPLLVSPYSPLTSGIWDEGVSGWYRHLEFIPDKVPWISSDYDLAEGLFVGGYLGQRDQTLLVSHQHEGKWKVVKTFCHPYVAEARSVGLYRPPLPYPGVERWRKSPKGG